MGESPEVQGALMLGANEALKRLGGSWMLQSEAQRQTGDDAPRGGVALAGAHAARSGAAPAAPRVEPGSRETRYYMTLSWWPPAPSTRGWRRAMVSGTQPELLQGTTRRAEGLTEDQRLSLLEFVQEADAFMDLLKGMLASCRPLTIDETTTYLHNCVLQSLVCAVGPMAFYRTSTHSSVTRRFWAAGIPTSAPIPRHPRPGTYGRARAIAGFFFLEHVRTCHVSGGWDRCRGRDTSRPTTACHRVARRGPDKRPSARAIPAIRDAVVQIRRRFVDGERRQAASMPLSRSIKRPLPGQIRAARGAAPTSGLLLLGPLLRHLGLLAGHQSPQPAPRARRGRPPGERHVVARFPAAGLLQEAAGAVPDRAASAPARATPPRGASSPAAAALHSGASSGPPGASGPHWPAASGRPGLPGSRP